MRKKAPKKFHQTKKLKTRPVLSKKTKELPLRGKKKNEVLEVKTIPVSTEEPKDSLDTNKQTDIEKTDKVLENKIQTIISKDVNKQVLPPQKRSQFLVSLLILIFITILVGVFLIFTKIGWSKVLDSLKKTVTKTETSSSNRNVIWDEFMKNPEGSSDSQNNNNDTGTSDSNSNNDDNSSNDTDSETDNLYTSTILTGIKNTLLSIQGEIDNLDIENLNQPTTYEF
ncbi:hypothetical protein A2X44_04190 [candidate division CPR3 bacterium GWF2_35_18]|uniref:Uncharacterized protein n=1 Tax=candidate division CPR3 bacterium GW2011_GWF2_35_18 TaxID=1618350 RepID=A0A0G0EPT0_UNCC3|nr:MAG: hypothetical protein UR67_C0007G0027 [candidate division CPR3 bacterium GW2011_GWF2_35_18]OGB62555.1 MAG: hypothetical protein A2X44_04190 [candidate division CPR3 bacterium GWF2_35_18]OGB65806.1 MAG: hypothetical protein A2250_01440 [candidate division CPR3 bacterium RIFOXYA2_FULL_35_13]OGB76086.1 MAG: hypothetical protein A2476_04575 [candidate division CPR3 bacterium RIFOXYC2_FULL_35_7]OGB79277.1 MAG: hypothetical protein A2296_03870 [candidate division CPR3 bacterium RIFOXYB2_FULL_3